MMDETAVENTTKKPARQLPLGHQVTHTAMLATQTWRQSEFRQSFVNPELGTLESFIKMNFLLKIEELLIVFLNYFSTFPIFIFANPATMLNQINSIIPTL